jgi:glutathione S-transferase
MLTLYRFPGATCAAKALLSLNEKGVEFEDRVIDRSDLATEWYRKLNPNGVVPTLTHRGETIIESSIIMNYVNEVFEGPSLRPSDPLARARMSYWMKRADDSLVHLAAMSFGVVMRKNYLQMSPEAREAIYAAIADPSARVSRRSVIEEGVSAPQVAYAIGMLVRLQVALDDALAGGGYLLGDYSLADAAVTPFMMRQATLGVMLDPEQAPHLHRWWGQIKARPSYEPSVTRSQSEGGEVFMRDCANEVAEQLRALRDDGWRSARPQAA